MAIRFILNYTPPPIIMIGGGVVLHSQSFAGVNGLITQIQARDIIEKVVTADDGRLKYSRHAVRQMVVRGITRTQVEKVLTSQSSLFTQGPYPTPRGDWKCTIKGIAAGLGVTAVVAIKLNENGAEVIVVTAFVA